MQLGQLVNTYNGWAVVTGASSGIGEEFAVQLAQQGFNVVLIARRQGRLEALGERLTRQYGVEHRAVPVDLAQQGFMETVVAATEGLDVGVFVNNAGFANYGRFLSNSLEQEERLLNVNCRAVTLLSHHFGNLMRQRARSAIVITASMVSFSSVPQWATYAASKSYDRLFGEALAHELSKDNIDVLVFCPGPTATEFEIYQGLLAKSFVVKPGVVVTKALRRLGRSNVYVPGFFNRSTIFYLRLLPRKVGMLLFGRLIAAMLGNRDQGGNSSATE